MTTNLKTCHVAFCRVGLLAALALGYATPAAALPVVTGGVFAKLLHTDTLSFGEGSLSLPRTAGMASGVVLAPTALSMGEGTLSVPMPAPEGWPALPGDGLVPSPVAAPVPEPTSGALLACGAATLGWLLRRRRRGN